MDSIAYNHSSLRAKKARLGAIIAPFYIAIVLLVVTLVILGVLLLAIQAPVGWLVATSAFFPLMVSIWYRHDLQDPDFDKSSYAIDQRLESPILARMSENPTPQELVKLASTTYSAMFLSARLGLTPNMVGHIAAEEPSAMQSIWEQAVAIAEEVDSPIINGAIVFNAVIRAFPGNETLLNSLKITQKDITDCICWHGRVQDLMERYKKRRSTGGIARDWSFGYTPLMSRFGFNISEHINRNGSLNAEIESHKEVVKQIAKLYDTSGRKAVVLVGREGVGKTTIIEKLAEYLGSDDAPDKLKYKQIISLDASALIASAPGRGQVESLFNAILIEAIHAKNIIVALDNAHLFFSEETGSVDITNILSNALQSGVLPFILAMDEQQYIQMEAKNSSLVNTLQKMTIAQPDSQETMRVMQDNLIKTEYETKTIFTYQSLREAYRLGERYVHSMAMPGQAIKILRSAANYAENSVVTVNSVQLAIEKTMDVKVSVASNVMERETLLQLESKIHQRMINQNHAVQAVSDALRRARAGVRNEERPIGAFLFLGPTGVGKTELAKALASVYFGGEDKIIRLDLNEFVEVGDVARLIADGSENQNSLSAQVMKQPFSVILLDEIEKAHPNVLTTLLQVLDEGVLRDEKNREVSFRDTIIIATSNAGADVIREHIERGQSVGQQLEGQIVDYLVKNGDFKPEFLNRFDEVAIFEPLGKAELLQVVDIMVAKLNKTLSLQKITVSVTPEAREYLVDQGYNPQFGARPMRRIIQRSVENTVAKKVLAGTVTAGSTVEISLEQLRQVLELEQVSQQKPPEKLPPFGGDITNTIS